MNAWLLIGGIALVIAALNEAFVSTLSTKGPGPVTGLITRIVHSAALRVQRRTGGRRVLMNTGPALLLLSVGIWIGLLSAGWLLVFLSDPGAVVNSKTGLPAPFWSRVYFTGYCLATLGNGDFQPGGPLYQLSAVLTAFTGLFLVTLAITFFVPVVSAVLDKRVLALSIKGLGEAPDAIVVNAWNGSAFPALDLMLIPLTASISEYGERHLAYPVLHYYHGANAGAAAPVRLAALDEAITLFEHGVAPEHRPNAAILSHVRSAITGYLDTLESLYVSPAGESPPPPDLGRLRSAGIPAVEEEAFREACLQLSARRKLLLASVRGGGWSWDDVQRTSGSQAF